MKLLPVDVKEIFYFSYTIYIRGGVLLSDNMRHTIKKGTPVSMWRRSPIRHPETHYQERYTSFNVEAFSYPTAGDTLSRKVHQFQYGGVLLSDSRRHTIKKGTPISM